jgi:hypothetical protein
MDDVTMSCVSSQLYIAVNEPIKNGNIISSLPILSSGLRGVLEGIIYFKDTRKYLYAKT